MGQLETNEVFLSLKTSIKVNGIACRATCALIGKYIQAYISINNKKNKKENEQKQKQFAHAMNGTYRQAVCRLVGLLARQNGRRYVHATLCRQMLPMGKRLNSY